MLRTAILLQCFITYAGEVGLELGRGAVPLLEIDLLLTLQGVPRTQQIPTTYGPNDKTTVHTGLTPEAILLCPLSSCPLADTGDQLLFDLVQCLMYCWHSVNNDQQFGISV